MEGRRFVTYPSQVTYTGGSTMCTSVCYMLGCGLISGYSISVPPTREQMGTTMQVASIVHRKLMRENRYEQHLFSVMEVQAMIGLPRNVSSQEAMGTIGPLPQDFILSFDDADDKSCTITDMRSFIQKLTTNSVALITVHDHTTAIYKQDTAHWYFDPMVASFRHFDDSGMIYNFLRNKIPPSADVFTGVVFTPSDPPQPHHGQGASS